MKIVDSKKTTETNSASDFNFQVAPDSTKLSRSQSFVLSSRKAREDAAKWIMSERLFLISLIRKWCSDFSEQDAEDVISMLCERVVEKGFGILGELNRKNLIHHVRREKENFRLWRSRAKRGGRFSHESFESLEEWKKPAIDTSGQMELREDLSALDGFLLLIKVEANGRLAILADVMRRVLWRYEGLEDLLEAMTEEERREFLPQTRPVLSRDERAEILKQISRTLAELRKRLRELRTVIGSN